MAAIGITNSPPNKNSENVGIQDTVALYTVLKIRDAVTVLKVSRHATPANIEPGM